MQRGRLNIRQANKQVRTRIHMLCIIRREEISVSTSDASTRGSLFCCSTKTSSRRRSEHRERRECRRHRHPIPRRVGRGRVINYASNSIKYREARLYRTQRYHLKATCEAQRFCEKSAAPPKRRLRRRRRGWRHFRLRLTSYAYVHDGYYRALRRPLYVTTCI